MAAGKSIQERGYLSELDVTAFAFTSAFAGLFIWFHSYQQVEVVYYFVGLGLIAGLRFFQNALETRQETSNGRI